jgi:hypothetical protein
MSLDLVLKLARLFSKIKTFYIAAYNEEDKEVRAASDKVTQEEELMDKLYTFHRVLDEIKGNRYFTSCITHCKDDQVSSVFISVKQHISSLEYQYYIQPEYYDFDLVALDELPAAVSPSSCSAGLQITTNFFFLL